MCISDLSFTWATQLWSICGPSLSLLPELWLCITGNANFKSTWPHSTVREGPCWVWVPLPALLLCFSHGYWRQMFIGSLLMQPLLAVLGMSNGHGCCPCQCRTCLAQGSLRSLRDGNFQAAPRRRRHLSQPQLQKQSAADTRHATAFAGESSDVHRFPDGSAIGWRSLAFNGNRTS